MFLITPQYESTSELYGKYFYIKDNSDSSENKLLLKVLSTNSDYSNNSGNDFNFEYSYDSVQWLSLNGLITSDGIYIHIPKKSKLYLRGKNDRLAIDKYDINNKQYIHYINIICTDKFSVGGNIMSLLYGEDFLEKVKFPKSNNLTLYSLFKDSLNLIKSDELILPATTLTHYCYQYMFYGCTNLINTTVLLPSLVLTNCCYQYMYQNCTSLTTTPELPATTLANNCYNSMFNGCITLNNVPELPATTLMKHCYQQMFYGCTNLTKTTELPATTLAEYCYSNMFYGCTKLTNVTELPSLILKDYCYYNMFYGCNSLIETPCILATTLANNSCTNMFANCRNLIRVKDLPATTLAESCYQSMFANCSSLVDVPSILPATTLANKCYYNMFNGCSRLINSPILPSSNLANNCYQYMFQGCSKLNYVTALFINYSNNNDEFTNWLNGVSSTGTFVRNNNINYNVEEIRGKNGIPSNWNVITE